MFFVFLPAFFVWDWDEKKKQDTVLLLSSGKVPLAEGDLEDFEEKLEAVCGGLAEDVVRNGEGTAHVTQVWGGGHSSAVVEYSTAQHVVSVT